MNMMEKRKLGVLEVGAVGLDCMSMSGVYGSGDELQGAETLLRAVELGVTLFDTDNVQGDRYGSALSWLRLAGSNDSE